LLDGKVDKQGVPESKTRADYIRLRDGLGAKDEVVGRKLYKVPAGAERAEAIKAISAELREAFVGLEATIRTYSFTDGTGEERDGVGGLVLPN
jgi:hypothetical protein